MPFTTDVPPPAVVPTSTLDAQVKTLLADQIESGIDSVSCPDELEGTIGKSVDCSVTATNGKKIEVSVTIDQADFKTVHFNIEEVASNPAGRGMDVAIDERSAYAIEHRRQLEIRYVLGPQSRGCAWSTRTWCSPRRTVVVTLHAVAGAGFSSTRSAPSRRWRSFDLSRVWVTSCSTARSRRRELNSTTTSSTPRST